MLRPQKFQEGQIQLSVCDVRNKNESIFPYFPRNFEFKTSSLAHFNEHIIWIPFELITEKS